MSNFITFAQTNTRFSEVHRELRERAVEDINKHIRAAKELPVRFPKSLLTDVECVQCELLRKLRDEGGWEYRFVKSGVNESVMASRADYDVSDTVILTKPQGR